MINQEQIISRIKDANEAYGAAKQDWYLSRDLGLYRMDLVIWNLSRAILDLAGVEKDISDL